MPVCTAQIAIWVLSRSASLPRAMLRLFRTVPSEKFSYSAISLFDMPCPTSRTMFRSVLVSSFTPHMST